MKINTTHAWMLPRGRTAKRYNIFARRMTHKFPNLSPYQKQMALRRSANRRVENEVASIMRFSASVTWHTVAPPDDLVVLLPVGVPA